MLSIVSLASEYDELDYASIMDLVQIESAQSLEELLISGITDGIISGRMDQEKSKFYVSSSIGRDVRIEGIYSCATETKKKQNIRFAKNLTIDKRMVDPDTFNRGKDYRNE